MPSGRRAPVVFVIAVLLVACSGPASSGTSGTSASVTVLPTPTPSSIPLPSGGSFPAMPGLTYDAALAWAKDFGFACQEGLFPPNRSDELLAAVCTRQVPADNAKLDLTIQYWPNDTVLAMSAAIQPITLGSDVSSLGRNQFFRWASKLPYADAKPSVVLDWLHGPDDCAAGCPMRVKGVHWTRTSRASLDAVSAFVRG